MSHWAKTLLNEVIREKHDLPKHVLDGLNRLVEFVECSNDYQFRNREFETIADNISVCDDLQELSKLMWHATTTAGFQGFSLFVLKQGNAPTFASRLCTSYNMDWLNLYQSKAYQFVDPVVAKAQECTGTFSFAQADNKSPLSEAFWADAEKHRIGRNGLCYVTVRPNGCRVAVSFSTPHGTDKTDELIKLNGYDLVALSQLAVECFTCVSAENATCAEVLSTNELRFLHMLATDPCPEKALLQVPPFGGNKALQASIRRKLKTASIFQAVSIASAMRWFDDLPFYADEVVSTSPKLRGWTLLDNKSKKAEEINSSLNRAAN